MARYFVLNLETEKLNIYTGGKTDWLSLPESDRDEIKRACLWSRSINGWVSRGKGDSWSVIHLKSVLVRLGFEDRGTQGEKLSFAAQVEAKQERAEARAERCEDRAMAAESRSEQHFKTFHTMMDAIPFGQPILVGHYSEKRDRNYRDRACSHVEKGVQEADKAKHYERRATIARETAEGAQYSDPRYLDRRIRECKAEIAVIDRRLAGKYFATVQAERQYSASGSEPQPDFQVSDEYRARLDARMAEERDKLGFFEHCLSTCGKVVYNRETLKGKQAVKIRGRWEIIVRLNPTTVAVPNICFPTEESQRKYALKYAYAEVQEAR